MSRSTAEVRFPDGTKRYTLYNNTVNECWRALFDTADEAWDVLYGAYCAGDWSAFLRLAYPKPDGAPVPVVIAVEPGDDDEWRLNGTATNNAVASVEDGDE